jgi:hypothetical protein
MNLSIQINENDFKKLGFDSPFINWDDLVEKIKTELSIEALHKCKTISEKAGLLKLTLDDINKEIKAARNVKSDS